MMTATRVRPKDLDVGAARVLCSALPRFLGPERLARGIRACVAVGGPATAITIREALNGCGRLPRVAYTNVLFAILYAQGVHENAFYDWFLRSEADRLTSAQQDVVRGLLQA